MHLPLLFSSCIPSGSCCLPGEELFSVYTELPEYDLILGQAEYYYLPELIARGLDVPIPAGLVTCDPLLISSATCMCRQVVFIIIQKGNIGEPQILQ